MRALRMLMAALGFAMASAFAAAPASAGGWEWGWDEGCCDYGRRAVYHDVYLAPRYVHVYRVHQPVVRYVHIIAYEQPTYAAFRYAHPYRYGNYWAPAYYRSYYPVRPAYPRGYFRHRHMK